MKARPSAPFPECPKGAPKVSWGGGVVVWGGEAGQGGCPPASQRSCNTLSGDCRKAVPPD